LRSERRDAGVCNSRSPTQSRARGILFFHHEAADDQRIHAGAEKRADSVGGRTDDRLAAQIEGRTN
jgi:hypothetical protein